MPLLSLLLIYSTEQKFKKRRKPGKSYMNKTFSGKEIYKNILAL